MTVALHPSPLGAAGFSLLEMLVAMSLLGMLGFLLLGGVQLGARTMDATGRRGERSAQLAVAYDFLRGQLAQAQPIITDERVAFDGRADGVEFVSLAAPNQAIGGHQQISIVVERAPVGFRVRTSWRAFEPSTSGPVGEALQAVLLDQLQSVEFSYFGATEDGKTSAWQSEWRGRDQLPALVMMRLVPPDRRPVPSLIVAPRLAEPQRSRP